MAILGLNRISSFAGNVTGRIVGALPDITVKNPKINHAIDWIGENISSPENRLILGVSALMSQPFIDLNNKKVDKETREVSACRTVAKIIAGTLTGVLVRYGCIKAIDAFTQLPNQIRPGMRFGKLRTLFTPDLAINGYLDDLSHHKKALGTILSLGVMTATNFLVDVPLTKSLTNTFVAKVKKKNNIKNKSSQYVTGIDVLTQVEQNKRIIYG